MSQSGRTPAELVGRIEDESSTRRREAAGRLARLADHDPDGVATEIPRLVEALTDKDSVVGERIGNALISIATDDPAPLLERATLERLQRAILTGEGRVRRKATIVFSELAAANPAACVEFVPDVAGVCRSEDEAARYYAVTFLVEMASARPDAVYESLSELDHVLKRDDEDAGDLVFDVLGAVGERHPEIVTEFEARFAEAARSHRVDRRLFAAGAIRRIITGDRSTMALLIDPLRELLDDDDRRVRNVALEAVERAVAADGLPPSAVESLLPRLQSAADRGALPSDRVGAVRRATGGD